MADAYIMVEAESLEILRRELESNKVRAYELLRTIVIGDLKLQYSGYKSLEDAAKDIIGRTSKDNERIIKAHEKKYPDKEEKQKPPIVPPSQPFIKG